MQRHIVFIWFFVFAMLTGCGVMNIYKNANEPVDRKGKENWALMTVEAGKIGRILISPRPRGNALKVIASTGNHKARS